MAMSLNEIRAISAEQFKLQRREAGEISETTPPTLTPVIESFVRSLNADDSQFIPVVDDANGLYGFCSDGVREKVKVSGGACVFGWTIWEWPNVLLTAEFHSVWKDNSDELLDITPKPGGERLTCAPFGPAFEMGVRSTRRRTYEEEQIQRGADHLDLA